MGRPFVVGICGGIGSGKSAAATALTGLGAALLDADEVAHAVLLEPATVAALRARFGDGVAPDGVVDRPALARLVFGATAAHDQARADLERLLHPPILERILERLRTLRSAATPPRVVVIDAPLLIGSPLEAACDEIVAVDAPDDVRRGRTQATRGWTADEHAARERAQPSAAERRRHATRVVVNDGPREDLEAAMASLYRHWTSTP